MHELRTPRRAIARVGIAALILLACAVTTTAAPVFASDTPTFEELVAKAERAATRTGAVLHTTSTATNNATSSTAETWIDLPHRRLRQASTSATGDVSGSLVADGRWYKVTPTGELLDAPAVNCYGAGLTAFTAVCDERPDPNTTRATPERTVTATTKDGRPAWLVTTHGTTETKKSTIENVAKSWFDRGTSLPFATTSLSTISQSGQSMRLRFGVEEQSRFVAADSLPPDFFTRESFAEWAKTNVTPSVTPGQRPTAVGPPLATGTASDGATWTFSETDQPGCFTFAIGTVGAGGATGPSGARGAGGGSSCGAAPNGTWVNRMITSTAGYPTFLVAVAPKGTKVLEVLARRGKHGSETTILSSDPIRMSSGAMAFVIELPDGAHNVRSARVVD